jgi:hypothetical protein
MLHHAPAFARSTRFAEQAALWLSAELMAPARNSNKMPEQSSSARISINEPALMSEQVHLNEPLSLPEQVNPDEPSSPPGQVYPNEVSSTQEHLQPYTRAGMQDSSALPAPKQTAPIHQVVPGTIQALLLDGLPTELGGALYLVNVLTWLDLPGGWGDAGTLAEHVGGWGIVEALARGLLGAKHDRYVDDPLWSVLASLDKRSPGIPVGATLPQQDAFRLPAPWLRRYGPAEPAWVAMVVDDARLVLFDENAGYLIADVPLLGCSPGEAIVTEVEAYQAQGVPLLYPHDEHEAQYTRGTPCGLSGIGFLEAGSRGKAPGGVSGVPPDSLSPFAPKGSALKNLHLRAPCGYPGVGRSGGWLSHSTIWWLERVLGFIRHLLARTLGEPLSDTQQLAELLLYKRGRLLVSRTHIDLLMSMDQISLPVRRAGLDQDPGWMPDLAHIVLFHFDEEMP